MKQGKTTQSGWSHVGATKDRIKRGGTHSHKNDGTIFRNKEGRLPEKSSQYYREFVHPTEGVIGAGKQRVILGKGGEMYYTPDHYESFIQIE